MMISIGGGGGGGGGGSSLKICSGGVVLLKYVLVKCSILEAPSYMKLFQTIRTWLWPTYGA